MTDMGLRERKKARTRAAIADAARRLFLDRGFANVSVSEVARLAEVSEATVFNYFRTKEDLFFSGLEAFEAALLDAVRRREPRESALSAFRRHILSGIPRLKEPEAAVGVAAAARRLRDTPSLRERELALLAGHARALAEMLAAEAGAPEPRVEEIVASRALVDAHASVLDRTRDLALRGLRGRRLVAAVEAEARKCFDVLERLGGFAIREERET